MLCTYCNKNFVANSHNSKKKYCGKKCVQAAYRARNKEAIVLRSKLYAQEHRDKILKAKRKYNASIKGKNSIEKWYFKNRDTIISNRLHTLRTNPVAKAIHYSRQVANKLLKRVRPRICEVCSNVHKQPLRVECHHLDKNPLNNLVENLKWLCSSCHGDIHSESSWIKQSLVLVNNADTGTPLREKPFSINTSTI